MSESYERQRAERILILAQTCDELGSQVAALVQQRDQLLAALEDACASLELQAATARHRAATRDREANLGLAEELERNCKVYRAAIAQAKGEYGNTCGLADLSDRA
jgi:hypothetical protein